MKMKKTLLCKSLCIVLAFMMVFIIGMFNKTSNNIANANVSEIAQINEFLGETEIGVPFYPYEGDDTQVRMAIQKNPLPSKSMQVDKLNIEILESTYRWILTEYDISEEDAMTIAEDIMSLPANPDGGLTLVGKILDGKLLKEDIASENESINAYGGFNIDGQSRAPEYPWPGGITVLNEYWLHEPSLAGSTEYVQWYRGWEGFDLYRSNSGGYQTFEHPFGTWVIVQYEGTLEVSDARAFGLSVTPSTRIEHEIEAGERKYVESWTTKQFCPYIKFTEYEYEGTYRFLLKDNRSGSIYYSDKYFDATNSVLNEKDTMEWSRVNASQDSNASTPQPPLGGAW